MFFTVYSISPLYFFLSISYLNLNYKKSSDNLTPNVPNYIHLMSIILQKYLYHISNSTRRCNLEQRKNGCQKIIFYKRWINLLVQSNFNRNWINLLI